METVEQPSKRARERLIDTGETAVQEPIPHKNTAKRSNNTVTIACNLPNGIVLSGWKMVDTLQPIQGGGSRSVMEARLDEELGTFAIKGNKVVVGMPTSHLVGGYAITRGVPLALWENWSHHFRDSPLIKNHCVFAHEKQDEVKAMARGEFRGTKSGLEPIDPENPGAKTGIRRIKRENREEEADTDDQG